MDKIRNTLHKSGEKRKSKTESDQTVKQQKTKHVEDLRGSFFTCHTIMYTVDLDNVGRKYYNWISILLHLYIIF